MTNGPQRSPEPDFAEKRVVDLRRRDTREISFDDLAVDAKRRSERRPKEIAAIASAIVLIIGALGAATVKVIGAFREHSTARGLLEYRVEQSEGDLKDLKRRADNDHDRLQRCHCPKEE